MRLALPFLALVACLAACGESYKGMRRDQVCRDTGYAIAARTLDCEGDTELADARYDAFLEDYECLVRDLDRDPIDVYYHCVAEINGASCRQIRRFDDDLPRYLALSPACAQYLSGPGLEAATPDEPDTASDAADDDAGAAGSAQ